MSTSRRSRISRTRDVSFIATPRVRSLTQRPIRRTSFTLYQDYRTYNPRRNNVFPRTLYGPKSFITATRKPIVRTSSPMRKLSLVRLGFDSPHRVIICLRRKIRKHVLHALGKTGKGGQKRPIRTQYSKFHCGG